MQQLIAQIKYIVRDQSIMAAVGAQAKLSEIMGYTNLFIDLAVTLTLLLDPLKCNCVYYLSSVI